MGTVFITNCTAIVWCYPYSLFPLYSVYQLTDELIKALLVLVLILVDVVVVVVVVLLLLLPPVALRPNAGHGLLILEVSRSHTTTHHSR